MKNLIGTVVDPDVIRGKSAYEVAVMNGFEGTVEEWLESLKGKDGGLPSVSGADNGKVLVVKNGKWELAYPSFARIGNVVLLSSAWAGDESPYSQVVTVPGVTANSQVDLTPSVEQLAIFHEKDLAFVAENDGGVVTVYAVGQKPKNDYTIQVTITEVSV